VNNNRVQAGFDLLPAIGIDVILVETSREALERFNVALNHSPGWRHVREPITGSPSDVS
jgi:hypothetical protein